MSIECDCFTVFLVVFRWFLVFIRELLIYSNSSLKIQSNRRKFQNMLGAVRLRVSFTHERTCFAYLNSKHSTKTEQNQCIQVLYRDKQIFLWVVFSSNVPENELSCNPIFSRLVGLEEGIDVFVSPYSNVKVVEELYIDTDSPEDQDILEHNVEILQLRLLDQLRLVVANQKSVVWISVSLPIVFTPKQTGILVNQSKVIVKVDAFNSYRNHKMISKDHNPSQDEKKINNIGKINNAMLSPYLNTSVRFVFRAVPIDSDGKKNLIHPYTVFIHEDLIPKRQKEKTVILATIENIPTVIKEDSREENENNDQRQVAFNEQICVEIVLIDNIVYRSLCHEICNINIPTVLISKSLNNIINIENGMKITLTFLIADVEQPEHINIVAYSNKSQIEDEIIDRFKTCVIESTNSGKKFVINNNLIKQNLDICDGYIQFKLKPDNLKYTMLNPESFRNCTVSVKCLNESDMAPSKHVPSIMDYDYKNFCRTITCFETVAQKVLIYISFEIHREACFRGVSAIKSNILVTGSNGVGKSSICQIIQKDLTMWSHIVHCRSLKGRKDITEVLSKAIIMCQEHSPAVLICDDIDSLVPPNMEGTSPQDMAYYQRLAVVIKRILQNCSGVCVLMTALSVNALHSTLREFNGKPMYTAHFEIPELDQSDRVKLFKHLINERIRDEFSIDEDDATRLAADTAGHNIRDIMDYLNKKIFKAVKKKNTSPADVKPHLIEDITSDKEKADAFDIWGSIGGMDAVKQELTECIFWPIMYPSLFPSQSCGILLYGPPGTGKSFIGSCLAKLKNMNFIAIKGPELLSKYIGQSEKAVRDIFDKADSKRPCILFFDEFDALAPKRGHDSTGVTDRVVNQLLSRLDGAEGGVRYPVLAATARPDLLDPALLRAGRLQRHLYCALPDRNGRHEVLKTLSRDINLSSEISLEDISVRTDGFSPADLKSLLVTSQLGRLERQLDSNDESPAASLVVEKEDMETALMETKPSLSREQLLFYDMIYKRFRGENLSPQEKLMSVQQQKEKVTLA